MTNAQFVIFSRPESELFNSMPNTDFNSNYMFSNKSGESCVKKSKVSIIAILYLYVYNSEFFCTKITFDKNTMMQL